MYDKLSITLFLLGLLLLLLPVFTSSPIKSNKSFFVGCNICAIVLLIISWVIREKNIEKYDDYNYALRTGKLAGGTVYASYPEMTPGLGWI